MISLTLPVFYAGLLLSSYIASFFPWISMALVSILVFIPFFVESEFHTWKAISAVASISYCLKVFEIALAKLAVEKYCESDDEKLKKSLERASELGVFPMSLRRLFHPFSFYDAKDLCFCKYSTDMKAKNVHNLLDDVKKVLPRALLYNLIMVVLIWIAQNADSILTQSIWMSFVMKYVSYLGISLTFLEAIDFNVKLGLLIIGTHIPEPLVHTVQELPILALSINEFWSKRWNKLVQKKVLKRYVYNPLVFGNDISDYHLVDDEKADVSYQGRLLASFITFFMSGIWHALPIWCVYGLISVHDPLDLNRNGEKDEEPEGFLLGLMVTLFFVMQFFGIYLENLAQLNKYSSVIKRIWVLGYMTMTSPLILYPYMKLSGAA